MKDLFPFISIVLCISFQILCAFLLLVRSFDHTFYGAGFYLLWPPLAFGLGMFMRPARFTAKGLLLLCIPLELTAASMVLGAVQHTSITGLLYSGYPVLIAWCLAAGHNFKAGAEPAQNRRAEPDC